MIADPLLWPGLFRSGTRGLFPCRSRTGREIFREPAPRRRPVPEHRVISGALPVNPASRIG
ncbi:hypothetical protein ACFPN9_07475 [Bosea massiliensis]|uniref:Uncharacterized protein n=1 Tax=Bosea massiliensis TaxID=151419 RepID=A0ABW0NXI2_9HYPH